MSNLTKLAPIPVNPDLDYLGTETAFAFGAEVIDLEMTKKFPQIYKFHVGDTGPKTPEPVIAVAIEALKNKQTKYGHYLGYFNVRKNIAAYISRTRGIEIDYENVMLTPGGKSIIELAIQALAAPDGYVIGQNPGYPIYESLARFYTRGKYLPWLARHQVDGSLEFTVEDLAKILEAQPGVKLLVLNTPQNPTGMMLSQKQIEAIAALVKKHDIMVLFDDIYDQIVFGGRRHYSILSAPGMLEHAINLNGYSKDYAMTGWRIGYVIAPKWAIKIFGQMAINKWSCINRVCQIAAGVIFGDVEVDGFKYQSVAEKIEPMILADVKEYERKGNFVVEALGLLRPYVVPNPVEGAFYDFPNVEKVLALPYLKNELGVKNEKEFIRWLLYEKGFACLAGTDFGEGGQGHIRLSYAEDRNTHIIPGVKHFIKIVIELIEKSGLQPPLKSEEVDKRVGEIEGKCF